MLIFRVCCKLHNFAIRERDPWCDTYGGVLAHEVSPPLTEGEAPCVRTERNGGNATMKERRIEWMLALKRANLHRRTRRN